MFGLDLEYIISLNPDLIVASSMIMFAGDPLEAARDIGIAVAYIPSGDSIKDVKEDIRFLAQILDASARGEAIIAEIEAEIAEIQSIIANITERRTVYYEISATPFTFGAGTFLHEMVEIAGGINIFADQEGWFSPSAEAVLPLDPDVILTSTNYIDDPIGELLGRDGWEALTAVQNKNVHIICADTSNRPSQNVVRAIRQIAQAVYPEYF
jgi:iron complex transport system substrate-binding protein